MQILKEWRDLPYLQQKIEKGMNLRSFRRGFWTSLVSLIVIVNVCSMFVSLFCRVFRGNLSVKCFVDTVLYIAVYCMNCSVQCTVWIVLYSVPYGLFCTVYCIHCSTQCNAYTVLYSVLYTLVCTVNCIHCYVKCSVQCPELPSSGGSDKDRRTALLGCTGRELTDIWDSFIQAWLERFKLVQSSVV